MVTEELSDIEALERAANQRPGSNPNLYENRRMDFSDVPDATADFPLFEEGRHPFKVIAVEEKIGKPKTDAMGYEKAGTPYVEIQLECTDGPSLGWKLFDRLMLEGKGISRLKMFVKAVGLLDENGAFVGCWGDFLGKSVWGMVETERREYQGKATERSKIAFAGYEPIEAWGFPKEDEFDEEPPVVEEKSKKSSGTPPWKQ